MRVCSFKLPCVCQELQPVPSASLVSLRVDDKDAYAVAGGIYSSIHVYARYPGADDSACCRCVLGKILSVVYVLVKRGEQSGCGRQKNDSRKGHAKQRQEIGREPRMLTATSGLLTVRIRCPATT